MWPPELCEPAADRSLPSQAYTLTTAGREGMLALLPVFVDHVLFPTITDSGFVTEVYPIPPPLLGELRRPPS